MSDFAPPSRDPGKEHDFVGMLQIMLEKFLQNTDDLLPAKVISFDRANNRVSVQPLIRIITTIDNHIDRANIASLPVLLLGGGGFMLNFNLQAGDLGWIKASDRDISAFLQEYKNASPTTKRKHSFEDALFIPDIMRGFVIAAEDASCAVLQSLDGTVKISFGASKIKITAPDIEFVSDTMKHNGTNIGYHHTHPQGSDSRGDAEQDTGYPK